MKRRICPERVAEAAGALGSFSAHVCGVVRVTPCDSMYVFQVPQHVVEAVELFATARTGWFVMLACWPGPLFRRPLVVVIHVWGEATLLGLDVIKMSIYFIN